MTLTETRTSFTDSKRMLFLLSYFCIQDDTRKGYNNHQKICFLYTWLVVNIHTHELNMIIELMIMGPVCGLFFFESYFLLWKMQWEMGLVVYAVARYGIECLKNI